MVERIELRQTYAPHKFDDAFEITPELVHALKFFKEHPLETVQRVPEGTDYGIYSKPYRLKDAGLIEYITSTNGIQLTKIGACALEYILQNHETDDNFCGNMLVVNTIPSPKSYGIDPVSFVTMDAYNEAVKEK